MILTLVALWATVLTGVVLLAHWSPIAGHRKPRSSLLLGYTHISVAVSAVVAWMLYGINRSQMIAVLAIGLLGAAVAAGVTTLVITRRWEEQEKAPTLVVVPTAAFLVHGAFAALAVFAALWIFAAHW